MPSAFDEHKTPLLHAKGRLQRQGVNSRRHSDFFPQHDLTPRAKDAGLSAMGFRELEKHIAHVKKQNFDLKLELHLRRERQSFQEDKLERADQILEDNAQLQDQVYELQSVLEKQTYELEEAKSVIRILEDRLADLVSLHKVSSPFSFHHYELGEDQLSDYDCEDLSFEDANLSNSSPCLPMPKGIKRMASNSFSNERRPPKSSFSTVDRSRFFEFSPITRVDRRVDSRVYKTAPVVRRGKNPSAQEESFLLNLRDEIQFQSRSDSFNCSSPLNPRSLKIASNLDLEQQNATWSIIPPSQNHDIISNKENINISLPPTPLPTAKEEDEEDGNEICLEFRPHTDYPDAKPLTRESKLPRGPCVSKKDGGLPPTPSSADGIKRQGTNSKIARMVNQWEARAHNTNTGTSKHKNLR
ncbi:hypothetical protein NEOLI_003264 [Neolecta irregularis DAH-3]|uniref:Centrosomin N-terminal motif 1 domain-containing protein n=1 Tax=Neolecta irregularis (strain DAH-3) TaxID=1198029 RepID=A0A1U7LPA5_NEOID|nr:hypothetical protein NEOLI_003264 [Neolecta irregularis DAH-3]|eukprot:OLL24485.1 hypothetical protein NEOLI_003264 [Neolecta irregularis DAH-3]